MKIFEWVCIGLGIVLVALMVLFVRREVISRTGGTVEMSVRLNTFMPGRGWAPGLGRFAGDELRFYRIFSLGFRPRKRFSRHALAVEHRRPPDEEEARALPPDYIIVVCKGDPRLEIAFPESTLTGFLSWLESAPPGGVRQM